MAFSKVGDDELKKIRTDLEGKTSGVVRAWMIKDVVKAMYNVDLDESTIRGRFIEMGNPLRGSLKTSAAPPPTQPEDKTERKKLNDTLSAKQFVIPDELVPYIPSMDEFVGYVERDTDRRLATHYNIGKHPISQGKQGTGKTWGHMYYAAKYGLPFFLYSGYEDFKLSKLFGDKTIKEGTIKFQESLFVQAVQHPSVILFDEFNAISNANTFDFHALLQNRELYVKDADDGKGKSYKLHDECRIGFAQNPKSAKYVGGSIKPSNFLGRCTYISYPEFTKAQLAKAIGLKFPELKDADVTAFIQFYQAIVDTIEENELPVDISIRQLNSIIELWLAGLPLINAIEDGMASILDAISQPQSKESFIRIAQGVWKELM